MKTSSKKKAYVNFGLIAVNIIYFLFLEILGSSEDVEFMCRWGAVFPPYVIYGGEYYRLLTSIFMHFGIEHIMNNMLILCVLGDNMERALGHVKYLIFYLLCGILANIGSLYLRGAESMVVSAGASGAIFGVIGGLLYAVSVNRGKLEDLSSRQLIVVVLCSLYFGFTSTGVDNIAHISGFLAGVILAAILYRKPEKKSWMEEFYDER